MSLAIFVAFLAATAMMNAADAATNEFLELRISDPRSQISQPTACEMLERADLEARGYRKEVTIKQVMEPGSYKPNFQTVYYFFKVANCSRNAVGKIGRELNNLFPGVLGEAVIQAKKEIGARRLEKTRGLCAIGMKLHLFTKEGCQTRRYKRQDQNLTVEAQFSVTKTTTKTTTKEGNTTTVTKTETTTYSFGVGLAKNGSRH